jgi:uroporphyrinogen III methyltransferase/synthase
VSEPGKVYLIGAGPGDPGLITVAGLQRLKEADVIVYDRLVSQALLHEAQPDAELIFVGKVAGDSHDQEAINRLLVEKAREGKRVVRLKGGDPFVFGRGGEEAEALRAEAIQFEVVPGVTSAVAVPAYAGIPVTHRGLASTFAVITGHEACPEPGRRDPEKPESSIDWAKLATAVNTLVFLMGTKTLPEIAEKLVEHGRSPETPAAVIRWGTTPEQQTVVGILADIASRVEEAGITPPAITVVGEVVRLREKLSWFEDRPLFGKRVLITRTRRQASVLARLLAEEGAIPIELPAIEIEPAAAAEAMGAAIDELKSGRYAWAAFTSANAVDLWFEHLRERGLDARAFTGTKVAAIGPATAEALRERGIVSDLVPDEYVAEAVVEALLPRLAKTPLPARPEALEGSSGATTSRILVPRAEGARPELVDGLRAAGAEVDEVTLYRAAVPERAPSEALSMLRDGAIDIVTFTSSSTIRNLAAMLNGALPVILSDDHARTRNSAISQRNPGGEAASARARRPLVACIGPITAKTAEELGLRVDVVATEYTVEGLVRAIREQAESP